MKLNITLTKAAEIMHGQLSSKNPQMKLDALMTDSRVAGKGDAFIALRGKNHDAHEFIPEVLKKGVSVLIGEKGKLPASVPEHVSVITVENTLTALQELAKYHRVNSTLKVAAVTGSNGKSTTKQMLKSICSQAGETAANMGNFNNQFGVPFSLLEIQEKHKYGVFELGASHPGDIKEIASITVPDVAVITNVSAAHLEFFKNIETVYNTKTEIIGCLNFGGTLVYNADDPMLSRLQMEYKGKAITFGFKPGADLQLLDTEKFSFTYKGEAFVWDLRLERHDKLNAAAACAAAIALGIYMNDIQKGLMEFTPMPMRMERLQKNGVQFILDCYNANPASMQNALEILGRETHSPRIAVLGDMGELGENSKEYHRLVARQLLDNRIEYAFLAGPMMKYAYDVLKTAPGVQAVYAPGYTGWTKDLAARIQKTGGTCLVKASRFMNFEKILTEI